MTPDEKVHELEIKFAKMDESFKSMHKRFDEIQRDVKSVNDLAFSVHEIAVEMKAMREDLSDITGRVKVIEEKPAKRWDSIVEKILLCVVTAIVAYFLARAGL